MAKTVCLDFDGVCNTYDGWKGESELFEPRPFLGSFLEDLRAAGYEVVIHSTRDPLAIQMWLKHYRLDGYVKAVTATKPPALCYIDDRAIFFNGSFKGLLDRIQTFRAHWETPTDWLKFHAEQLASLDQEKVQAAVAFLGAAQFSRALKSEILEAIAADRQEWWMKHHFHWGMAVRNLLRENGFGEEYFRIANLDDYWVALVERAVGIVGPEGQ